MYYVGLIEKAARHIGLPMFTADDNGVHPEPLNAKLPECVEQLVAERDSSQHYAQQLREALIEARAAIYGAREVIGNIGNIQHAIELSDRTLSLPHDASALDAEPLFWYRPCCDGEMYEGPIHNAQIEKVRKESGVWIPLYPAPKVGADETALDRLVKDAARYRWLCDCAGRDFEAMFPYQMTGRMSEIIDAAMQEVKE
jgi:hypothetical protein